MGKPRSSFAFARAWPLLLWLGACAPSARFECDDSSACTGRGGSGICESTGFCSFADTSCETSGRRYSDLASAPLAGACVVEDNLIANGTFETGIAAWRGFGALIEPSDVARSGAGSMRVCEENDTASYSVKDSPDTVPALEVGTAYRGSAWVHDDVAAGHSAPVVEGILREQAFEPDRDDSSAPVACDATWRPIEVARVAEGTGSLTLLFRAEGAGDGSCFLIDDVALVVVAE